MGQVTMISTNAGVAVITLENPAKLNAWDVAMREQLCGHLRKVTVAPPADYRAVVIVGSGDAFCSGQDLDEAYEWDSDEAVEQIQGYLTLYDLVRRCPRPVVAAVNGVAAGSGFQLALCCDYRVSHESARLGQPEVRNGQASVTGSWFLAQTVGIARMRAIVLTAELISGQSAYAWGLVDSLVPSGEVLDAAIAIATKMGSLPAQAFAETKLALAEMEDEGLHRAFEIAIRRHRTVYGSGSPRRAIAEFRRRK